jgi:hypothetical protein
MMTTTNSTNSWLPLAEYSMKHNVSISTLRRRIKTEDIRFRFDDGKYFILDEELKKSANTEEHRPSLSSNVQHGVQTEIPTEVGESVITAANRLLADLKKAYTQILQEKEEQILSLREETMDLKTLIKVLEAENSRLRN